jgi:hypothetical protein
MASRLNQLYDKLGLSNENGLFFLDEADTWIHIFPYRVSRIIKEVIKPDAFFCLYTDKKDPDNNHPKPFNQSFLFFFDKPNKEREELIHKQIINFGLTLAVFINREDILDLYHGSDFSLSDIKKLKQLNINEAENFSFINQVKGNVFKILGEKKDSIDKFLLKNITDARRILVAKDGLKLLPKAANRLIGRLLFISYLIDRNVTFNDQAYIVGKNKNERKESFKKLILNKPELYNFFNYLTNKYDGDIFPLVEDANQNNVYNEIELVNLNHLSVLSHLFNCSSFFGGGKKFKSKYTVQKSLFDLYDFEIIPVEFISSIYENFIGIDDENENLKLSKQKDIKAYYTPSYIVDYILSQTVTPFLENKIKKDSNCKVLDPACGSGIFLVETLRKIIEKEFEISNKKKISDTRLWQLIKSNIYGIDIDSDAIDITIFSLYITILDYKQPAEIENFKFQKLKEKNLFGGIEADFFNIKHSFNDKLKGINFIIGNPPWGHISKSRYIEYIKNRNETEKLFKNEDDTMPIQIGNKEICQAFLVRTSDFISKNSHPKCSFIVSSKVFYNSSQSSKNFREYFLSNFHINQVVELSPVNNKIRGGNHIFENAKYPAAIISFSPAVNNEQTSKNVIQHITIKPNIFFLYYKTILIEKHDVKRIKQEYFIEKYGGFDWLWKTLVHGNILDIHFIKRLKEDQEYKTAKDYFEEFGYKYKGGLKLKDGNKKIDASHLLRYDFLDAEKEFRPFIAIPSKKTERFFEINGNTEHITGYLPNIKFFEGNKLLFKKGVVLKNLKAAEHHFQAVTAYNEGNICFTSTVASLVSVKNHVDSIGFLSTLSALYNSKLFTYFILHTGASLGIEKSRINFDEFEQFPIILSKTLGKLSLEITNSDENSNKNIQIKKNIESQISRHYQLSETEIALIDYANSISIPTLLRERKSKIFKPLSFEKNLDKNYIIDYIQIFKESFKVRFDRINKSLKACVLYSEDFIRINFHLVTKTHVEYENEITKNENIDLLGDLGFYEVCKDLYIQQDVRGFTSTSFYIVKPNERKLWHKAVAYLDVMEFEEEITKTEINQLKSQS